MFFVIFECADVFVSAGNEGQCAPPIFQTMLKRPNVLVSVCVSITAFSMLFIINPLPNVCAAIRISVSPLPMKEII